MKIKKIEINPEVKNAVVRSRWLDIVAALVMVFSLPIFYLIDKIPSSRRKLGARK